jgi:poly-beta-1,6-N-acetyl-D-glucosamine synthase
VSNPAYIVVTPVRNEREHFARTIASMVSQTMRPQCWVIVDDGSQDGTDAIADCAAQNHSWIRVVHRPDRGARKQGGGVIEAFYDGLKLVEREAWDFLIKLDGDLSFDGEYFEQCFRHFERDPKLGVGGGTVCVQRTDGVVPESKDPAFHVRGATKIYRRALWEAMSGLVCATGWDTCDEVKANMLGWKSYSFPEVRVLHHRPTGAADGSWRNSFKNGRANYITGYHPLFMLAKCAKRIVRRPYVIDAAGLLAGFFSGYLYGVPQVADRALVQYLRREQLRRLVGKSSLWDQTCLRRDQGS